MKKIIYPILMLALLLSLSLSAVALGNSYTFTTSWWQAVFNNIVFYDGSTRSVEPQEGYAQVDGITFDPGIDYENRFIWFERIASSSTISITIPLNVELPLGYDSLNLTFLLSSMKNITINSVALSVGGSSVTPEYTYTTSDVDFGYLTYSGSNTIFTPVYSGSGGRLDIDYIKNISSKAQTIDSLTINLTMSASSGSIALGAFGSTNTVVLPDAVYDSLYNIKVYVQQLYSRMGTLIEEVRDIQTQLDDVLQELALNNITSEDANGYLLDIMSKLDELASAIGQSGSYSLQLSQYLQQPNEDQQQATEELKSLVQDAKDELAEIKETLTSVTVPTMSDIEEVNSDINVTIDEALQSEELTTVLGSIFEQSTVISMMLIVISLATVGYVMFGKRA